MSEFKSDSLSELRRNRCPNSIGFTVRIQIGFGVRITSEYAANSPIEETVIVYHIELKKLQLLSRAENGDLSDLDKASLPGTQKLEDDLTELFEVVIGDGPIPLDPVRLYETGRATPPEY